MKLLSVILISCSGFAYAQSDLDRYYSLEEEVAKLRAQFRDNQSLISETNTTSNHFWSPSSTKKILDRLNKDQDRILKEMEPKIKAMRRLEQTLEVKAWDYRFGALEQVNTLLSNVSQNNTCSAQSQQLFTSDKAFEAWNNQNGDLDRKVAYYAEKNGYISNCLNNVSEGNKKDISRPTSDLCKKIDWLPDKKRSRTGKYKLKKENGKIVLSASLYFTYKGDAKNKKESVDAMKEILPCMKDFYARHGIKLDLAFKFETGTKDWWSCDHSLNLWDKTNRANSQNWVSHHSIGLDIGMHNEPQNRCSLALHELGHLFGLSDTYPDPYCPDREEINGRDDIMYSSSFRGPDDVKLYPGAVKDILKPFCGE